MARNDAKYLQERFRRYFVLGRDPKTGRVDLSDHEGTLAYVSPLEAQRLVADRDAAVNAILFLAAALAKVDPDELDRIMGYK